MNWLIDILFAAWWHGESRTKASNAADKFVLPALVMIVAGCLIAVLIFAAR